MSQVGPVRAPEQEHLLLYPTGEPEGLLGREVQLSDDGGWTIAEGRAPGCEVIVRRSLSSYQRTYNVSLSRLATFSAGYAKMLGLTARYGGETTAGVEVNNREVLLADLRGPCGSHVIDSVRVGTGTRRLQQRAEAGAQGSAAAGQAPLGANLESEFAEDASFSWTEPQGYAFSYKKLKSAPPIGLAIEMPEVLHDGEELAITVKAERAAHLVVYFLEESGEGGVLYPSSELPEPFATPDTPLILPPLKAALREPGVAARETFVVYAFVERGDFQKLKPATGSWGREGAKYAAQLTEELSQIPMDRWARVTVSYTIIPK